MRFKGKVDSPCYNLNWAYINFLQVGKNIIMPKFNIEEDTIAQQYIQEAFQDCNIRQIEMAEIAKEGGALHCFQKNHFPTQNLLSDAECKICKYKWLIISVNTFY